MSDNEIIETEDQLTQHFARSKFACKCQYGADYINRDFAAKLETARVLYAGH